MSLTNASPEACAKSARLASHILASLPVSDRNSALTTIHAALENAKESILSANTRDLEIAKVSVENQILSPSLLSRLDLSKKGKWDDMLNGILSVRDLDDPVGKITMRKKLDDGLELERISCPIGVILIIFESRPEVIANIASLAIKSGNAAILKGGKESSETFIAISRAISTALDDTAVPNSSIQLVQTRQVIPQLLELDQYIDLVIPRGSNDLVKWIKSSTKIPVLGHADGICCIYLEHSVNQELAVRVLVDSKTAYPAACNSVETLLVEAAALETIFPTVARALLERDVTLRCDETSKNTLLKSVPEKLANRLETAKDEDFNKEHLTLILSVKVVSDISDAISHINTHGSHHTDCILTKSAPLAEQFMSSVDSAGVYWNTSTRMADGMRYGFGTEVGISTNKIHARGPVGLEGLMIYKYKLRGTGQVSLDYGESSGQKRFKHENLDL